MTFDLKKAVAAGGVIKVPAGVYDPIVFKKPCTLLMDPAAVLHGVSASNVDGIEIHGGQMRLVPDKDTASFSSLLKITGGKGHRVLGVKLMGGTAIAGVPQSASPNDPRPGDAVLGLPIGRAMTFSKTTDVEVSDCEMSGFFDGINFGGVTGLHLLRNHIHDIRTTGMHGTVVSDIVIDLNIFQASRPWNYGGKGDHGDWVHIWTDAKLPGSVTDRVVMTRNRLLQGDGAAIMGLFFENNSMLPGRPETGGFTNVQVDHNTIISGNPQAIAPDACRSGSVSYNTMIWTGGPDPRKAPSILLRGQNNLMITGNVGPDTYHVLSTNPGNTVVPPGTVSPGLSFA